jgi:hypothetical protein
VTDSEIWSPREVAQYLRLFKRNPTTKQPDPAQPDPYKIHQLTHTDATFPRPIKMGKHSRYLASEIRAWFASKPRGNAKLRTREQQKTRRGPKPKAVQQ